jgi:hypothetical protein
MRSAIVIGEIALSLVLLTAAGLVVMSFRKVIDTDLGFQADRLLSLQVILPHDRYPGDSQASGFVEQMVNRLNTLPGRFHSRPPGTECGPHGGAQVRLMLRMEWR